MNIRKTIDYSALYAALDALMELGLQEAALYYEIGKAVCTRKEKGAAVIAAEYLQERYPCRSGLSPRNLRRMRAFYIAYAEKTDLLKKALRLGWTRNVVILEGCQTAEERTWYLNAALKNGWTKGELLEQIRDDTWQKSEADKQGNCCYTESKTTGEQLYNSDNSNGTFHRDLIAELSVGVVPDSLDRGCSANVSGSTSGSVFGLRPAEWDWIGASG